MSAYFAFFRCRLLTLLQYRAAAFAGMCTQIFWGIIKVMVFSAFYREATSTQPLTLSEAIGFIWIGQALIQLIPWNVDREIDTQIKTGNIAFELLRPLNLYFLWFVRSLAIRSIPTLLRCIPLFIVAKLFLGLPSPTSLEAGFFFILSLSFSLILSAAITTLVLVSLFWTLSGQGLQRLLPHFSIIFSGVLIPLPLFPESLQTFLNIQPFRCIIDIPTRIYMGLISTEDIIFYLALQLFWSGIFIYFGKWLMQRAMHRVVIQGG